MVFSRTRVHSVSVLALWLSACFSVMGFECGGREISRRAVSVTAMSLWGSVNVFTALAVTVVYVRIWDQTGLSRGRHSAVGVLRFRFCDVATAAAG